MIKNAKTALVLGGSGLVGKSLISGLLQDIRYRQVVALGRSKLGVQALKLADHEVNFQEPSSFVPRMADCDHLFCCLGTTLAQAGSREAFRQIDCDLVLMLCKAAKAAGVQRAVIISSVGADPKSNNFYLRTKGEMEQAIAALGFPEGAHFVRPSVLVGSRPGQTRMGEKIGIGFGTALAPLMLGSLRKYRPIYPGRVATAMRNIANWPAAPQFIESDELERLADL